MKKIIGLGLVLLLCLTSKAQETKLWTEADRKYLLDNLVRSRDELVKETERLTEKQWRFKESPDRWSINEVVEHIGYWEILLQHEIANSLEAGLQPERHKTVRHDSTFVNFIMQYKPHYSLEYTKPFSYTIPMGLNTLASNRTWLLKMRNESIEYLKIASEDLRLYFNSYGSVHQIYIYVFGHMDRHLRQIRKVKQHANYPK